MRQKVGRKIYDTEKATRVGQVAEGDFGQAHGFEETLYRRKDGDWFLEGVGGPESPYPEHSLVPLDKDAAHEWVASVMGAEAAAELFRDKPAKSDKKASKPKKKKA